MSRDPSYIRLRVGGASIWIRSHLGNAPNRSVSLWADPDQLFAMPQCEIMKDRRSTKAGHVMLDFGGERKRIYMKRYNAFSWRYRLRSLFILSEACRSWVGAGILTSAGFQTAKPIAAVEWRSWGMLTRSFYLSEEIPTAKTVGAYWREDLLPVAGVEGFRRRRDFLKRLASLFRSLHELNVYHNDLKDANILFCSADRQQDGSFYLVDLQGIRRYRHLSKRRRLKNLAQFNRTMGKHLRWPEKLYLLKVYLGNAFFDPVAKRKWIRAVLKSTAWLDREAPP